MAGIRTVNNGVTTWFHGLGMQSRLGDTEQASPMDQVWRRKRDVIIGGPCPLPLQMPLRDVLHSTEIITQGLPESPPTCIFLRTLPSSPTLSLFRSVGASQTTYSLPN